MSCVQLWINDSPSSAPWCMNRTTISPKSYHSFSMEHKPNKRLSFYKYRRQNLLSYLSSLQFPVYSIMLPTIANATSFTEMTFSSSFWVPRRHITSCLVFIHKYTVIQRKMRRSNYSCQSCKLREWGFLLRIIKTIIEPTQFRIWNWIISKLFRVDFNMR